MQARALIVAILALGLPSGAWAEDTRVLSSGRVASDATDTEGETIGGIGSAIEVVPDGVVMLSDRGAGDGMIDYRPRLQFLQMQREGTKLILTPKRTVILRDSNDRAFTGLFPDKPEAEPPQRTDGRMCLDPEGLALAPNGNIFLSEEYLPSVREFSPDGKFLRRFETPAELVPRTSRGTTDFATDDEKAVASGRQPNRGFEGLALLPDGRLAALLQSGLAQDGGRRAGSARLIIFDVATGRATAAYRVPFSEVAAINAAAPEGKRIEAKHLAFSSLTALPDGRLLALERENFGADGTSNRDIARWKAVVLLDLRGAGDILGREDITAAAPVQREVLFNLAALDVPGLPREDFPAKWEGLAIVGLTGDRIRLLLSSDNDFLNPHLSLRNAAGEMSDTPFPRAERAQDTWIVEVETTLPPAPFSASRSSYQPKQIP
ncbi:MAG: esterase-like activity of phytase family protein [Chthoniobacterales bacterium]